MKKCFDLGKYGEFWMDDAKIMRKTERTQLIRIVGVLYLKTENETLKDLKSWGMKFREAKEYGENWYKAPAELFVKAPVNADPLNTDSWICFEIAGRNSEDDENEVLFT